VVDSSGWERSEQRGNGETAFDALRALIRALEHAASRLEMWRLIAGLLRLLGPEETAHHEPDCRPLCLP